MCKLLLGGEGGRADLTVTDSTRPAMWATSSSECGKSVQCVGHCVYVCVYNCSTNSQES